MNNSNEFTDIEVALRRLKPRQPSEVCRTHIAEAFGTQTTPRRFPRIIAWGSSISATVCATALVLTLTIDTTTPTPKGNPATTAHVSTPPITTTVHRDTATPRTVSSIEALDLRKTPDGRLFLPYRIRYTNTAAMPNAHPPSNNPRHTRDTPSEEVHFVGFDVI
ncbi:MAG: hypothetical protein LBD01_02745 [Puniceicoccales bacterium]|jgi:hypothetical protein|nr:hypothetical protein [Puniceicoccales bacterium]